MPYWLEEILIVWNYRSRSYWLILIGIAAYFSIPLFIDWYWSTVELKGQFAGLEDLFASAQNAKYDKRGLFFMLGCWITASKFYFKDRKKLMGY